MNEDEDGNEAQAGIPVVFPGAVAMIGMDSAVGRQVTGYDSGFDGEESDDASSGILEPPPLPEEGAQLAEPNDELAVEQIEIVEGIDAELHVAREEIFVEGQVFKEKALIASKRVQFLVFSVIVGTVAIVVTVVVIFRKKGSSNLRGISAIVAGHVGWNISGDIMGPTDGNQNFFGQSIALSASGQRMVIGAPGFHSSVKDINVGQVQLFDWNGTAWKMTQSMNGFSGGSEAGSFVALSRDGLRTVVGSPHWENGIGLVAVYKEPAAGNMSAGWGKIGEPIVGNFTGNAPAFGSSVSMSRDGTVIAVAAPYATVTIGANAGVVRVYQEVDSVWTQVGTDLEGEIVSGAFGSSIALASNGTRIAVGGPSAVGSTAGLVKTFDWVGFEWATVGQMLTASDVSTTNFGYSVSLSDDGSILSVGAVGSNFANAIVQVYRMVANNWTELGSPMTRPSPSNQFGQSICLSGAGETIAVGSPKGDGMVAGSGEIAVFKYDGASWTQVQGVIGGANKGDNFGSAVAISGRGNVVAGGAPSYNFNGVQGNAGKVQTYQSELV